MTERKLDESVVSATNRELLFEFADYLLFVESGRNKKRKPMDWADGFDGLKYTPEQVGDAILALLQAVPFCTLVQDCLLPPGHFEGCVRSVEDSFISIPRLDDHEDKRV